jgi:hypothetical protein
MLWFLRGVRRRVVTTRYPRGLDSWSAGLPTPPAFAPHLLTPDLSRRLVDVCPGGALAVDGDELTLDLARCTCCGRCLEHGGDAVRPSGVFELATRERAALVKRFPIGGTS